MKRCPTCNRTYADDTFTFCLDDGALLSAPFDAQPTLQIPEARNTDQPRTEILTAPPAPERPKTLPLPATTPAPALFGYGREGDAPARKTGAGKWLLGGVIMLLAAGVLVLGYIVWRGNEGTPPEASKGSANAQANSGAVSTPGRTNVNGGANGGLPKTAGDTSPQWLEGVWEGTGYQHAPKMTWSVKLTAENNVYSIEYPSLRCGGRWNLVETGEGVAKFKEVITRGLERCSTDGDILVEKISDRQVSYKYTLPVIGEVATATLSREAVR